MSESIITTAFMIGIFSACSLPLGAMTAFVWHPSDRVAGALLAFGGGALLAALTIDLVAPAFQKGHFYAVATGCVLGGLMFILLNEIVNNYGGFLRKVSTTVYHLRRQEHRRFKRILSHLGRIDIFQDLPANEFKAMAALVISRDYEKGMPLYHLGDPPDALYIVADGEIQLLDPLRNMQAFETLRKNDAFGRMAFLTGQAHATVAVAHTDVTVWILPRGAFDKLLAVSPELLQAMIHWLGSDELITYLQHRHDMSASAAAAWSEKALHAITENRLLPPALDIVRKEELFISCADKINRAPVFKQLSPETIRLIAERLIHKRHQRGETFFQKGEYADRMYIIEQGEVSLIDPDEPGKKSKILSGHDAFGSLSLFTGSRHTTSAVATQDTGVWVLRKNDFDELIRTIPELEKNLIAYLQQEDIVSYLEQKQHFDPGKAIRWINLATKNIDAGRLIPAADEMATRISESKGAPVAIWLGIMLDGVPESLVIGASLIHFDISLALIAGLFISNYPEAMFSSIGMRQQGLSRVRITLMWTSLMLFTGIGAALGNVFFVGANELAVSIVEGLAAGAMLTMIAQTMLPEAYFKGGSIVGFATLLGFLAALFFKSIG